jgi:hypothetical protein
LLLSIKNIFYFLFSKGSFTGPSGFHVHSKVRFRRLSACLVS